MKILAIRGMNLASLAGEFAVDLEAHPLQHAGLFAITGATGSGKSTLLDALCLALFDKVPRLADNQGYWTADGEGDARGLRSNDVRGILRRGTVRGYAQVDFRGENGGPLPRHLGGTPLAQSPGRPTSVSNHGPRGFGTGRSGGRQYKNRNPGRYPSTPGPRLPAILSFRFAGTGRLFRFSGSQTG